MLSHTACHFEVVETRHAGKCVWCETDIWTAMSSWSLFGSSICFFFIWLPVLVVVKRRLLYTAAQLRVNQWSGPGRALLGDRLASPPGGPRGTETQPRPRAEPPSCLLTHTWPAQQHFHSLSASRREEPEDELRIAGRSWYKDPGEPC